MRRVVGSVYIIPLPLGKWREGEETAPYLAVHGEDTIPSLVSVLVVICGLAEGTSWVTSMSFQLYP